ncbi:MAG: hypothetical protein A3A30_02450 [Candidatus Terrybacteria bacterium RIFCSPLOWO2_01_FULL_48_14]|nr:MAG: hypothetical protein A3A30_02450 [Candidatus Terrybacteria bacterium RIFCSPLOWO2_01_FULL_48_14]
MFAIFSLVYILIALILLTSSSIVFYHFRRFSVGGNHKFIISIFIVGSVLLFLAGFAAFASVDWKAIYELALNLPRN